MIGLVVDIILQDIFIVKWQPFCLTMSSYRFLGLENERSLDI